MNTNSDLLQNLDKLHTTGMGIERIKRNLSLHTEDAVDYCKNKILLSHAVITRNGKNWYVDVDDIVITVNAYSYTIITAHKKKRTVVRGSKKVLVTGGTVFVSRFVAEYYVKKGYDVYVLNRNNRPQCEGVRLIEADRKNLGDVLKGHHFDIVLDITAYTGEDVNLLLDALGGFEDYVLISSSAVYPEYETQPFTEESTLAVNKFWGKYGTDKIDAEEALIKRVPNAYILRPPYLYGPMNNVYREAFVFDCAMQERKFYLPKDGGMKLQFFHVEDLCRFIDVILDKKPKQHIFNVGNKEAVSIKEWVTLCYKIVGKEAEFVNVYEEIPQRSYFSFYDYEYYLDVRRQCELMPETKPLAEGLREALAWYLENIDKAVRKPLIEFIDENLGERDKNV